MPKNTLETSGNQRLLGFKLEQYMQYMYTQVVGHTNTSRVFHSFNLPLRQKRAKTVSADFSHSFNPTLQQKRSVSGCHAQRKLYLNKGELSVCTENHVCRRPHKKFINTGERVVPRRQPLIIDFQHEIIEVCHPQGCGRGRGKGERVTGNHMHF